MRSYRIKQIIDASIFNLRDYRLIAISIMVIIAIIFGTYGLITYKQAFSVSYNNPNTWRHLKEFTWPSGPFRNGPIIKGLVTSDFFIGFFYHLLLIVSGVLIILKERKGLKILLCAALVHFVFFATYETHFLPLIFKLNEASFSLSYTCIIIKGLFFNLGYLFIDIYIIISSLLLLQASIAGAEAIIFPPFKKNIKLPHGSGRAKRRFFPY